MRSVRNSTMWLSATLTLLLAGCTAHGSADEAAHVVRRDDGSIVLSGEIGPGVAAAFAETWNASLKDGVGPRVRIASPGGSIAEAFEIAEMLSAVPQGAETVVPVGGSCLSACAIVFLAGERRFMEAGSVLGFHGVTETTDLNVHFLLPPFDRLIGTVTVGALDRFVGRDEQIARWVATRAPKLAASLEERNAFDRQPITTVSPADAEALDAARAIP